MSDVRSTSRDNEADDWLSKLDDSRKDDGMHVYEERCHTIREKYRYEGSKLVRTRKYQMLWSNIQTMQSAIYSKAPHAVVSRRFRDQDPIARTATEVLERAINFTFDAADFDTEFKMVRDDFLLYARGVARIYYEPEYETEDDLNEDIIDAEDDISSRSSMGWGTPNDGLRPTKQPSEPQGDTRTGAPGDSGIGGAELRGLGDQAPGGGADTGRADQDKSGAEREPKLKFENVRIRFVQRRDFRHQPARTWDEVQWVAFRAFMTRSEVTKRFGAKIGKGIELDADPLAVDEAGREGRYGVDTQVPKAAIWEIWDKARNEVLWISPGWPDILEVGDPYLDLDGFYPCPCPAYGTVTTDSLVPVPDFVFYQDQADEIDQLTARIAALSDALKLVGFYPAGPQGEGAPEIERAMAPGFENKLIAVQSWSSFIEGGQSKGAPIIWLPVDMVANIIKECIELRKQLVEDVYQIIGISDIMRGATDPQETEGAQQLKAQYGGTRIKDRQEEIARFCRDIARLSGQVIAQYCSPQTIMMMTNMPLQTRAQQMIARVLANARQAQMGPQTGAQVIPFGQGGGMPPQQAAPPPQAMPVPSRPSQEDVFGLIKDNLTRRFKIDIETDSTVAGDESQEKADRTDFIESLTKFMEAWGPMVMQKPELAPLAGQVLLFGVRAFRVGRELEEVIEETVDKLAQPASQMKGPDAKVQAEQIKLQATQAKTQAEIQKAQVDAQTGQQSAAAKLQEIITQSQARIAEARMKLMAMEQEHGHKIAEAQMAHGAAMDKIAIEQQKAQTAQLPKWPTNPDKSQGF